MKTIVSALVLALAQTASAAADAPDCIGGDRWPAVMALVQLKNAGITDPTGIDSAKTVVLRLASERRKARLFRQVHHVTYVEKSGRTVAVITVSDATVEKCSMGPVDVFLVEKRLDPEAPPRRSNP